MDTPQHAVSAEQPAAHLTRDHMCLLASQVYSREADALYYGDDRPDEVASVEDLAEAERLYQLAQEVAAEVTGDPEHINTLWTEATEWLRGGAL